MEFELIGSNFNELPQQFIGITSDDNALPLKEQNTTQSGLLFYVVERTDTRIVLRNNYTGSYGSAKYLGALLSEDRQTVYWTNTTRPLP